MAATISKSQLGVLTARQWGIILLPLPSFTVQFITAIQKTDKMMSTHHLEEISSECGDGIALYIRWNSARLIVHLDPSPLSTPIPPIENSFIERYKVACDAEDVDEAETLSNDILDAIVEAGRPILDQLAPPPAHGADVSTHLAIHSNSTLTRTAICRYSPPRTFVSSRTFLATATSHVLLSRDGRCAPRRATARAQRELDCLWKNHHLPIRSHSPRSEAPRPSRDI